METRLRNVFLPLLLLGLYLTLEGYRSYEGDQAYRLPLFLHSQTKQLFEHDPFVQAFDEFNPHTGYFFLLGALSSRLGLAATLIVGFAATFLVTGLAVERIARRVWFNLPLATGWVAFCLFLLAKAGNIGTNHLFEPMLLDRLVAFALGWLALAEWITQPRRSALTVPAVLFGAQSVHPSLGLQLFGLFLGLNCLALLLPRFVMISPWSSGLNGTALLIAFCPTLIGLPAQSRRLFEGLDPHDYLTLAAFIQSPQHMIPHLWRHSQWLAWAAYPALAIASLVFQAERPQKQDAINAPDRGPRNRLIATAFLLSLALAAAWFGIEVIGDPRMILFQPFRMATFMRGICLIFIAPRLVLLWKRATWQGRARAVALAIGLTGDWLFVVVAATEIIVTIAEAVAREMRWSSGALACCWALGLFFLTSHDPQSGHLRLAIGLAAVTLAGSWLAKAAERNVSMRLVAIALGSFVVPLTAILVGITTPEIPNRWQLALLAHIRLVPRPVDDMERLADWCRRNTPANAVFIGPPGPKSFRLWSRRALAFNRAGSPYHAAGLANWANRYCDHVGLPRSVETLAQAYLQDRHALERRFDQLDEQALVQLAERQGAQYLLLSSKHVLPKQRVITPLHVEGRYQVCRVARLGQPPVRTPFAAP
jgi:hypothetical protein